jgi:DNA-binding transcriptional ArsR family regulator
MVVGVDTLTHGQVLARFGHALSDPVRARLLLALRESSGYPAELADTLGTSRQNVSNHLACPRLAHALGDLLGLVLTVDPGACPAAEHDGCC